MKHYATLPATITRRCVTGAGMALVLLALFFTMNTTALAVIQKQPALIPESFSELADAIGPAVVNIRTETTTAQSDRMYRHFFNSPFGENDPFNDFFERFFNAPHGRQFKQRSLGSGFIIDSRGLIVTNNHVVENADKIIVKLKNGDEFDAKVVGTDANTDLALLEIEAGRSLPSLDLGDSDDLKVGEWVVAIGSPFGLEQTVTAGIVSAKGRVIGAGPYDDFIQTDASINPGNSGGPLVNLAGEVVGINTAIIASGQGIGFAIPANLARNILEQLETRGHVIRGWLGVGIQPVSKEMAEYYNLESGKGALVTEVFPGDPADKAGIKTQDIILEVNGKEIKDSRDLSAMIAGLPVGETIKIMLLRDGKKKTVTVKITERDDTRVAGKSDGGTQSALDLEVSDITEDVARKLNLNSTEGVYVSEVTPGGKGDRAGIQPGDVIREINRQRIQNTADFEAVLKGIKEGDPLLILIRKSNGMFMVIKTTR